MLDFDKLLDEASNPEMTVHICLDGKLVRRWEEVRDRVDARKEQRQSGDLNDDRLGLDPGEDPEQPLLDQLTAEVTEHTVPFLLRAMDRDKFPEFLAEARFEARKNDAGEVDDRDKRMGLNAEAFPPALVRASIVEPSMVSDQRWDRLWKVLTAGQAARLFNAAWSVNREDREVPFSPPASPSPRS